LEVDIELDTLSGSNGHSALHNFSFQIGRIFLWLVDLCRIDWYRLWDSVSRF
jgi:hypothetical protein